MNAVLEQINITGQSFVEYAFAVLIQSGVLIAILLLLDLVLRKRVRAVFRYWIWLLVLLKLVLPISLSTPISLGQFFGDELAYVDISQKDQKAETTQPAPTVVSSIVIDTSRIEVGGDSLPITPITPEAESVVTPITSDVEPATVSVAPLSWQAVVFLLWLAVVTAMGILLLQRAIFVRGLIKQARDANNLMNETLEYCRKRMGVKRNVCLKISVKATSPAVCGLFRPVILLPRRLGPTLDSSHLQTVLMHELAHIKRGDLWINTFQTALQIFYFYNPLLWLANTIIRRVREQAVDEAVLVALGPRAQQYPETLMNVARLTWQRPALSLRLIGVIESKSQLKERIRKMLERPVPKNAKLGIAGMLAVVIAAVVLLPMAKAETEGNPSIQSEDAKQIAQNSEPSGEMTNTIKGFVTDRLGRSRGNVHIAASSTNIWEGIRSDVYGSFTLQDIQPDQKKWIAYSQASRSMGLFTIPEDYTGQPIHVILNLNKAEVEGRVVGPDGKGLADRKVELIIKTKQGLTYSFPCYDKTDRYGNYEYGLMPCGSGLKIQARLADANEAEQKYVTEAIALSDNQIFIAMPKLVIGEGQPKETNDGKVLCSGRVVNEKGEPIPDVEVRLTYRWRHAMGVWGRETMTDEQGSWSRRLPADHSNLTVRLSHPDYISYHFDRSSRKPSKEELLNGSNIMIMKRGLYIRGRVLNQNGTPIENVLVAAGRYYSSTPYGEVIEDSTAARTLADGTFSIGGLPQERIDVQLSAVGYAPNIVSVEIKEKMDPIEVTLRGGKSYAGQVVDMNGNPIEGVEIDVGDWRIGNKRNAITRITKTDSQGWFRIENLPDEGKIELDFGGKKESGFLSFGKELPQDLSQVDRIVMYKIPVFVGKVIDAETQEPITSFTLTNGIKSPADDSIDWSRYYKQEVTSEDGTFNMTWGGYFITYPFDGACYLKIEAKGYLPETTPPVKLGKEYEPFVIRMAKAEPWKGSVVDQAGKAAVKAEVGWVESGKRALLNDAKFDNRGFTNQAEAIVQTDSNGRFEINPTREQGFIVVVHADGYAHVKSTEFANGSEIKLNPWAKIEGAIVSSDDEKREVVVTVNLMVSSKDNESQPIGWLLERVSISDKHFTIDHVPSIPLYVGQLIRWELSNPVYIKPEPGMTYKVQIGSKGRRVIGKVIHPVPQRAEETGEEGMSNPRRLHVIAYRIEPESKIPDEIKNVSRGSFSWLWRDAKNVYERSKTVQKRYIPNVKDDGTFEFEDMPHGKYELVVNYHAPLGENVSCGRGVLEAVAITKFAVEDGRSTKPIRIPDIDMKLLTYPNVGDTAPLFEAKSFDDKTIKLVDFHGKVVLLDFWATWCAPCVEQIPKLKEVYDNFSTNPRFVMIGMSVDWNLDKAKKFVVQKQLKWPQVCLGSMDESLVVKQYGVGSIPTTILISPDGKIIAKNPSAEQLKLAISKALGL
jgi:beta-lactamase regulating signal transducer with metallopeptidase domain/peroxiredoxin/uncharacterized GH25 family protein